MNNLRTLSSFLVFLFATTLLAQEPAPIWLRGGHVGSVTGLVYADSDRVLVSCGLDRTIRTWDASKLRMRTTIPVPGNGLTCISVDASGRAVATADIDGSVYLTELPGPGAGATPIKVYAGEKVVRSMQFANSDSLLLLGMNDGTVLCYDVARREEVHRYAGPTATITDLDISRNGRYFAAASDDFTTTVWEPGSGRHIRTIQEVQSPARVVGLSPSGDSLVTLGYDPTIPEGKGKKGMVLFETLTGRMVLPLTFDVYNPFDVEYRSAGFTRSGRYIRIGGTIVDLNAPARREFLGLEPACFSQDGREIAAGYGDIISAAFISNGDTGPILSGIRTARHHRSPVYAVALSPGGARLLSADDRGEAMQWDATSGEWDRTVGVHAMGVRSLAWTKDGESIVTASSDGSVKLWTDQMKLRRTFFVSPDYGTSSVAVSADGRLFAASAPFDTVLVEFDTSASAPVRRFSGAVGGTSALALSPDGSLLAAASQDGIVRIWRTNAEAPIAQSTAHGQPLLSLAFSVDGTALYTGDGAGTLRMIDPWSGATLYEEGGHSGGIAGIAASQDGRAVFTAGLDSQVVEWRLTAENFERGRSYRGYPAAFLSVSADTSMGRVAVGCSDATVLMLRFGEPAAINERSSRASGRPTLSVLPTLAQGAATLHIDDPTGGRCVVTIDDPAGRRVDELPIRDIGAGLTRISLDLSGRAEGLYFVRVRVGDRVAATRVVTVH